MATRHNRCVNPSMTNDVANWGGNGAAPVRTAVSGFSRPFAARYTDGTFIRTAYGAITAGEDCTVAVEIRFASFDFSGTIFIEWQDGSHGALSYTSTGFSATHGVVTRIEVSGTAPASTQFVAVIIGNETFSVNTCDVTAHLIEPVPGPADTFFDGEPPGSWDGATGNSASTLNDEQTVALSRATETDTARTLTLSKTAALGRAAETDTARPLVLSKTLALGRTTETDTARPLAISKNVTLGRATETDTARPLTYSKTLVLGRAIEHDTARALILSGGFIAGGPGALAPSAAGANLSPSTAGPTLTASTAP